jgi:hypothetical protein
MRIELSVEFENAFDSIRFNDDGDSNEMDESDLQNKKQHDVKCVTELATQIRSDDFVSLNSLSFLARTPSVTSTCRTLHVSI